MFLTILSRGFQLMAAGIILALSAGAIFACLIGLLAWAHDGPRADVRQDVATSTTSRCPPPVYPTGQVSRGQEILEAYRCVP